MRMNIRDAEDRICSIIGDYIRELDAAGFLEMAFSRTHKLIDHI